MSIKDHILLHSIIYILIIIALIICGGFYYHDTHLPEIDGIQIQGATAQDTLTKVEAIQLPNSNVTSDIQPKSGSHGKAIFDVYNNAGKFDHVMPKQSVKDYWAELYDHIQEHHLNSKKLPPATITFKQFNDTTGQSTTIAKAKTNHAKLES